MRDLNFVLRFEIFFHTDGQLQASHLILGVHSVYRFWKPFSQAISLDSPLLSYIDVRHANFLPPSLTIGEVQDFGLRYITTKDLAPLRDELAERVSRALKERGHVLIEENEGQVQAALTQAAKPREEEEDQDKAMVTRRKMTINRFLLGAQSFAQPQGGDCAPPPPTANRPKKKQKVDHPTKVPYDVLVKTPPRENYYSRTGGWF